eukprot:1192632-Prorocentrum_minimum.AAC.5
MRSDIWACVHIIGDDNIDVLQRLLETPFSFGLSVFHGRPVGGSSTGVHKWCEQVVLPTPSPRNVSLSSSQRLNINAVQTMDDPLWCASV